MEKIRSIPYMIAIKKGSHATFFLCAHLGSNQGVNIIFLLKLIWTNPIVELKWCRCRKIGWINRLMSLLM